MMTPILVEHLVARCDAGTAAQVLRDVGETRTLELLADDSSWSSYSQFRCLLEAAAVVLGGVVRLRDIAAAANLVADSSAAYTNTLQTLRSPATLYADMGPTTRVLAPIVIIETDEVGPSEWIFRQRFEQGFAPFPEYCAFAAGSARVPRCSSATHRSLQDTLGELVSMADVDQLREHVVSSVAGAVRVPAYILVLHPLPSVSRHLHFVGIDAEHASRLADQILANDVVDGDLHLVVDAASSRRSYGKLVALNRSSYGFYPRERRSLQAAGKNRTSTFAPPTCAARSTTGSRSSAHCATRSPTSSSSSSTNPRSISLRWS